MLKSLLQKSSSLTTALDGRYCLLETPSALVRLESSIFSSVSRCSSDSPTTQCYELTRVSNLIEGCDYEHWFVVMEPPKGYPLRDEIVNGYITTLAIALGSEEEAKKSIYSVSTKYYYAFGCKIHENLTLEIKCKLLELLYVIILQPSTTIASTHVLWRVWLVPPLLLKDFITRINFAKKKKKIIFLHLKSLNL
ncbi:hypothetical protein UlMin_016102 [Ulmus minor]